jgi:hypothetical protein
LTPVTQVAEAGAGVQGWVVRSTLPTLDVWRGISFDPTALAGRNFRSDVALNSTISLCNIEAANILWAEVASVQPDHSSHHPHHQGPPTAVKRKQRRQTHCGSVVQYGDILAHPKIAL